MSGGNTIGPRQREGGTTFHKQILHIEILPPEPHQQSILQQEHLVKVRWVQTHIVNNGREGAEFEVCKAESVALWGTGIRC